ncbi:MAG: ribosome biogenesis GTPase RsgA [Gammaproteobacteria bacterium]|nr:ribosome biogenesis GTPase RsgA [Gammaproteobacteria bacterium]
MPRRTHLVVSILLLLVSSQLFARGISLEEAVERARDREGGRVISAETREWDGQRIHNIRLLTKDGKVKRIRIDGKSGKRMKGRGRR